LRINSAQLAHHIVMLPLHAQTNAPSAAPTSAKLWPKKVRPEFVNESTAIVTKEILKIALWFA